MLKSLLCRYGVELSQEWEEGLPWLLLAAREAVQDRTIFSPNELFFGHSVSGPITMLHDAVVPMLELGDGQEKVVIVPGKIKRLLSCSHLFISLQRPHFVVFIQCCIK